MFSRFSIFLMKNNIIHTKQGKNSQGPPQTKEKVVVVMPAYNAAATLVSTHGSISADIVDEIILVDDCSTDDTVNMAKNLEVKIIRHARNLGYGGNQKTCYRAALSAGADIGATRE